MTVARWKMNNQVVNSHPKRYFHFRGVQATGTTTEVNDTWNLETLAGNKTEDALENHLGDELIDQLPSNAAEIGVYLNGLLQDPVQDYTLTAHSGTTSDLTITFLNAIGADDKVVFCL